MRFRRFLFPLLGVLVLGPAGAARAQPAETPVACREVASAWNEIQRSDAIAGIQREAAAEPNGEGRLFRIERDGVEASFLFGTMHLSDPRVVQLPPEAETAFAETSALVIETTDVLAPAGAGSALLARPDLMLLPNGGRLAEALGTARTAALRPALEARGIPFASVETLQPWFVAAALAASPCEAARAAGGAEVLDIALARRASDAGKPVLGLETAAEQMEALASLPVDLQAEALGAALLTLDQLPRITETMIDLYLRGLVATIEPALRHLAPQGSETASALEAAESFEERVIRRRNAAMAERLQPILAGGGRFVAVGALHLPGETGLVAALRRAGWRVERAD